MSGRNLSDFEKEKIILMTKIAVYEKEEGRLDSKKMTYFINDFSYRRNAGLRAGAMAGCLILILLYALHKIVIEKVDMITGVDYGVELRNICIFVLIVLVAYSVAGTIVHMMEYRRSSKRIKKFQNNLEKLENLLESGGKASK